MSNLDTNDVDVYICLNVKKAILLCQSLTYQKKYVITKTKTNLYLFR